MSSGGPDTGGPAAGDRGRAPASSLRALRRVRWYRSIGLRLTGWYFVVFLGSTLLIAFAASLRIRSSIHAQIVETARADLRDHRLALDADGIEGLKRHLSATATPRRDIYVRVVDGAQLTVFEHRSDPGVSFKADSVRVGSRDDAGSVRSLEADDRSRWSLATAPLADGGWLQVAVSDQRTTEVLAHLRAGMLAVWIGAVALGLVGGFLLTRRMLRPLGTLAATTDAVIASGDLALRVPGRGSGDELDELIELFNRMLARQQTLVRGMREALDNVAHDLRTPLTRLRTGAEVALGECVDVDRLREALGGTIEESEDVLAILETLMDISEAETGVMKLAPTRLDLNDLARSVLDVYEPVAEERGVRVITHLDEPVVVHADRPRLQRAMANLIDNALKYTPAGGHVEVTTASRGSWAVITFRDSGCGIPHDELPRIWDRLYRVDRSRSERGLGLGLSFVRAIVTAHGGTVGVESEFGAGARFTIQLPRPVAGDAS